MIRRFRVLFLLAPGIILAGCAAARWVAGTSLSRLRAEQEGRFSYRLPLDRDSAFSLLTEVAGSLEVYEYLSDRDEGYLVTMGYDRMFPACIDTTEVGFFLSAASGRETDLKIVSLNHALARFVSDNFPYYALQGRERDFPSFALAAGSVEAAEIIRQVVESRGNELRGKGNGYLVASGLRLERGEAKVDSPLVFFLQEIDSGSRTKVTVGSFDVSISQPVSSFMEKACNRALQAAR